MPEVALQDLTPAQQEAVTHAGGPLLVVAGAGTGKTTVITRRIASLIAGGLARPEEILALTFTEKAAAEMEERLDVLLPYGYLNVTCKTFHAFGDQLLRDHAGRLGLNPVFRVLSQAQQLVLLRRHVFDLPLQTLRPLVDPTRFLPSLASFIGRAKDELAGPEALKAYIAQAAIEADVPATLREAAAAYEAYERLLRAENAVDFGDQVLLAIRLLETYAEVRAALQKRYRFVLVDEFQDTNFAQFRLLQLLIGPEANITVVADDDQSIYKWRGAALSNVVKFLEQYPTVRTLVLTENYRSPQPLLDCAYRLIQFNNPDRLEARQGIDKRLVAKATRDPVEPKWRVFETISSEADWVARTIRESIDTGARRPRDFAILVRSNKDADPFLRALNVAGVPWQFSGASGLLARPESKLLLSCLKALADPEDSLSWYHVASSALYEFPMADLTALLARARRTHKSLRSALTALAADPVLQEGISDTGQGQVKRLLQDIAALLELSRNHSAGQLLYRWLSDRGILAQLSVAERLEDVTRLHTIARFFHHLRQVEELIGTTLPEVIAHLDLLQAIGNEPLEPDDAWIDRVSILTIHKAKGLEFPVVFLVSLVQGRFPTAQRSDVLELPEPLIQDLLPEGDYHLQEERRLFYVAMTRAKEALHLTCAYNYGGKTRRKVSRFVLEALDLPAPNLPAKRLTAQELIAQSAPPAPSLPLPAKAPADRRPLRLDPHGVDDYLTCPLKYRFSHIIRIPVLRHHAVAYGTALHKAVETFFQQQMAGHTLTEAELLAVFEAHWSEEGFLTKAHEELRWQQGQEALRRFHAQQLQAPETPTLIEAKFAFPLDDLLVVGRWDRVDRHGNDAVIIDYKSSNVQDQATADRRTRQSSQLLLYALAWQTLHSQPPSSVELRFLESGLVGSAQFDEDDFDHARSLLRQVAQGIKARDFHAQPDEFNCRWCAYQAICPHAFKV